MAAVFSPTGSCIFLRASKMPLLLGFSRKSWVFAVLIKAEEPGTCNKSHTRGLCPPSQLHRSSEGWGQAARAHSSPGTPGAPALGQGLLWQLVAACGSQLRGLCSPTALPWHQDTPHLSHSALPSPPGSFHAAQHGSLVYEEGWSHPNPHGFRFRQEIT